MLDYIEIDHVEISYFSEKDGSQFVAARDLSFQVKDGEFTSILGPSGCGKSSLLLVVGGLLQPSQGEVRIQGTAVQGPGADRAMVFQEFGLLPWRTALDNIAFGLELQGVKKRDRHQRATELLQMVGLEGFERSYPHQLSGGMRQRIGIARALAVDPFILLMDEPFGALDAQTREVMADELLKIWSANRKTVLFVTHSIDEALFLSDRIVVMSKNPGTVKEIVDVGLPRPRSQEMRDTDEYGALRRRIWSLLFDEISDVRRVGS